ncbi:N-acetylneuraminate synthase [Candidatus Parcubacteria bacterium]|nr:MAG: N-acetylneuraminate synthase [Candidatus Parcubacteria bacterium]
MMIIDNKSIGTDQAAYIIAEIGINYNGSFDTAMKLLESAARCGVDAVKFQLVTAEKSYTMDSHSYSIFKKNELSFDEWEKIVNRARELDITVFSTFANSYDLKYMKRLDLPAIKISSTNITNFPFLESIAQLDRPVIISTGMSYLSEVDEAIRFLENKGLRKLGIMHCTSLYPASPESLNLRAIQTLRSAFPDYPIGFSDHTIGNHCAIAAVACGACIIEKHFTLDKQMNGPDHHFSANPRQMKVLVKSIREIELALGSSKKLPSTQEHSLRDQLRRSLVAAVNINQGQQLKAEMLITKRSPIKGIEPRYLSLICGRYARTDIPKDSAVTWDHI